jgi:hypothetical protein
MNDNDIIPFITPQPTADAQYTQALAHRLNECVDLHSPPNPAVLTVILSTAMILIQRDIIAGRFVNLEHIGEFVAVDNHGPEIRYQPDRRLAQGRVIHNLKQAGGN